MSSNHIGGIFRLLNKRWFPKSQYETEALERMKEESRKRQSDIQIEMSYLEMKLRKLQPIDSSKGECDIKIDQGEMSYLEVKLMKLIKDQQWELEKYLTLMEEKLDLKRLTEMMKKNRWEHETMMKKERWEHETMMMKERLELETMMKKERGKRGIMMKKERWEHETNLSLMEENLNLERLTEMMMKEQWEHETMIKKERREHETMMKKERWEHETMMMKERLELETKEAELITKAKEIELQAQQAEAMIKKHQFQIKPVGDAPQQSRLADLDIRLKTFEYWPADSPVSSHALAKAGFYYDTGSSSSASAPDCCRCFYCGVSIAGWKSGDDPYVEHALSPNICPFIKQCEGERFIETAKMLAKLGGQVTRQEVLKMMNLTCCIL